VLWRSESVRRNDFGGCYNLGGMYQGGAATFCVCAGARLGCSRSRPGIRDRRFWRTNATISLAKLCAWCARMFFSCTAAKRRSVFPTSNPASEAAGNLALHPPAVRLAALCRWT
jgi:hypothetical protein